MPRQKSLHKYSQEYYDLCKRAHNAPLRIPFETERRAYNFRTDIYQFRVALRKALLANPDSEDLQLAVLFAEGLEFLLRGKSLLIRQKRSSTAEKIAEVLRSDS